MSDAKFQPGITCDKCGLYTNNHLTYDGRDVCVSCYVGLKLENNDYE